MSLYELIRGCQGNTANNVSRWGPAFVDPDVCYSRSTGGRGS